MFLTVCSNIDDEIGLGDVRAARAFGALYRPGMIIRAPARPKRSPPAPPSRLAARAVKPSCPPAGPDRRGAQPNRHLTGSGASLPIHAAPHPPGSLHAVTPSRPSRSNFPLSRKPSF